MELHLEDQTPAADAAEAAPVRRRASRRVSAAAGAAPEVAADAAVTVTETAAAPAAATDAAPAADAADAAAEAAPAKVAPKRASRSRKKVEPEAAPAAEAAAEATAPEAAAQQGEDAQAEATAEPVAEAPKKRATRSRKAAVAEPAPEADKPAEQASEAAADTGAQTPATETADAKTADAKNADAADTGTAAEAKAADTKAADSGSAADEGDAQPARRSRRRASQATDQAETDTQAPSDDSKRRGRGGSQNAAKGDASQGDSSRSDRADRNDRADRSDRNDRADRSDRNDRNDAAKGDAAKAEAAKSDSDGQGQGQSDANKQENGSRSSRTRQRDRKRRGGDDLELEIAEDDVLLPVAGILDVLDNYAFVRTSGYLPGVSDVYVALGQVKKYSLRRGDALVGAIRQPREGDSGGRQKYNAIVRIDSVNGKPVEETETRPEITEMTPVFPQQRLKLDAGTDRALGRAIDAIAPIGLGQRGLLVLPEQFSGSEVIRELAADISANAPDTHLMVVLTDAQPEVATELSRSISGEVVAATFDRLPEDQTTISELGIDRARRLVELGHDVVVLVDSLNRLARGYAQSQQPTSRPAIGAVDEHAIFQVKRLLAAARNVENGGSLTVLATVRAENGNEADTILLREVKGVVNSVIEFDANSTIDAPKLNAQSSRTHHLSAMLDAKELAAVNATRAKQLAAKPAAK